MRESERKIQGQNRNFITKVDEGAPNIWVRIDQIDAQIKLPTKNLLDWVEFIIGVLSIGVLGRIGWEVGAMIWNAIIKQ